jgi:hypothetical protein
MKIGAKGEIPPKETIPQKLRSSPFQLNHSYQNYRNIILLYNEIDK